MFTRAVRPPSYPVYNLHPAQMVWALLVGPVIGAAAVGVRLIQVAILGGLSFGLSAVLLVLKPLPPGDGDGVSWPGAEQQPDK